MKKMCMFLLMALMLVLPSQASAAKKIYRLTFASYLMDTDPIVQQVYKPWLKEIEKRSQGRIKCVFYNPNTICNESEIFDAVAKGRVMAGTQNAGRNPGLFPLAYTYCMGFTGCTTSKSGTYGYYRALESNPELLDDLKDYKPLWAHATGCPSITTTGKQVKTIEDMKGLHVFVPGGNAVTIINALGGTGTQMPMGDFYLSLQRHMGDACLADYNMLSSLKIHEVAKFTTVYGNPSALCYAVMNKEFYQALPDDLKKIIDETTGEKMAMTIAEKTDSTTEEKKITLEQQGQQFYTIPREERQKFVDAILQKATPVILKPMKDSVDTDKYLQLSLKYSQMGEEKFGLK